jgi:hypothetical protein
MPKAYFEQICDDLTNECRAPRVSLTYVSPFKAEAFLEASPYKAQCKEMIDKIASSKINREITFNAPSILIRIVQDICSQIECGNLIAYDSCLLNLILDRKTWVRIPTDHEAIEIVRMLTNPKNAFSNDTKFNLNKMKVCRWLSQDLQARKLIVSVHQNLFVKRRTSALTEFVSLHISERSTKTYEVSDEYVNIITRR